MPAHAKITGKLVDLRRQIAQGISLANFSRTKGVFIFAQRCYDVGKGLQRSNDMLEDC